LIKIILLLAMKTRVLIVKIDSKIIILNTTLIIDVLINN